MICGGINNDANGSFIIMRSKGMKSSYVFWINCWCMRYLILSSNTKWHGGAPGMEYVKYWEHCCKKSNIYLLNQLENMGEKQTSKLKNLKFIDDHRNEIVIKKIQKEFGEKKFIKPWRTGTKSQQIPQRRSKNRKWSNEELNQN